MTAWAGNTPYGVGDVFLGVSTAQYRNGDDLTIARHDAKAYSPHYNVTLEGVLVWIQTSLFCTII
jgi:pyridoxal/pyridoxine/pyridoxamine kinase